MRYEIGDLVVFKEWGSPPDYSRLGLITKRIIVGKIISDGIEMYGYEVLFGGEARPERNYFSYELKLIRRTTE